MEFGRALNKLREERFVTKKDLASKTGISRQQIKAYEDGKNFPTVVSLLAIADFLEVSADELLGRNNYVSTPADSKRRYVTLPDELSDEDCKLVKEFINLLLKMKKLSKS
jgi:transcriptional regulator with XRE-family HTH domain